MVMQLDRPAAKKAAAEGYREQREFESDRKGHNNPRGSEPVIGLIVFMAAANGYVMARRPGAIPFVISEKLWRSFPLWGGEQA